MQEKVFLAEIYSLDNKNGCFARNSYFAELFGISKRRVSEVLHDLTHKGFIRSNVFYKGKTKEVEKRIINICSPPYPINRQESIEESRHASCEKPLCSHEECDSTLIPETSIPSCEKVLCYNKGDNKEYSIYDTPLSDYEFLFNRFWNEYPKNYERYRKAAFNAFVALSPNEELLDKIISDRHRRKNTELWNKEEGRFIFAPANYLKKHYWKEKPNMSQKNDSSFDIDEIARLERERDLEAERKENEAKQGNNSDCH